MTHKDLFDVAQIAIRNLAKLAECEQNSFIPRENRSVIITDLQHLMDDIENRITVIEEDEAARTYK